MARSFGSNAKETLTGPGPPSRSSTEIAAETLPTTPFVIIISEAISVRISIQVSSVGMAVIPSCAIVTLPPEIVTSCPYCPWYEAKPPLMSIEIFSVLSETSSPSVSAMVSTAPALSNETPDPISDESVAPVVSSAIVGSLFGISK